MVQVRYRFRTDAAAVDSTPTWAAAENTNYYPGLETAFRLRFTVNNTGTAAGAGPHIIRLSKNAGAYAAITTSSTAGVQSVNAGASADEATIATANFRLTAGTGTALAGVYDETGSATKSITNGFYTELEYGLIIKTANVTGGDVLDFRIYNSTTAYTTYTQTPRIMIPTAALANDVSSASSVSRPAVNRVATYIGTNTKTTAD
jgi:hypothetical protein